jgi:sugar lactone lactonase YvrE
MRRFSLQLLAFLFALGAVRIITGAETFAPYLLRDGLIVAVLAAALFAWQGGGWQPVAALRRVTHLSTVGHMLWLTGLVCLVAGGIGVGFDIGGLPHLAASLVWGLGIVLSLAGVWWPGAAIDYAPPAYRWETDAAGRFIRTPLGGAAPALEPSHRAAWGWTLAVIALGAALRFWQLADLPAGCVGGECIDGLRLVDGQMLTFSQPGAFNLFERLARLLFSFTGDGILSLRLAGATLGSLTVLLFAGVTKRLTAPIFVAPALLLALNPWHIWASRVADGWIVPALLVTLALWLTLAALAHADLRWWMPAGLALGLLWVEAPPLRAAVLLWAGMILALGLWAGSARKPRLTTIGGALVALVGVAAPAFVYALLTDAPLANGLGAGWAQAPTLTAALLRPDLTLDGGIVGSGLLSTMSAALMVLGVGTFLRAIRQPAAIVIGAGILLFGVAVLPVDLAVTTPRSLLLPLLPLLLATAVLALDRLLTALVVAWGRIVRPARLAAAASLFLFVLLGVGAARFAAELHAMQGAGDGSLPNEIARFVAEQLATADAGQTYVAPTGVLNHPSVRLLAGAAINEGRVQVLDFGTTMPYAATPPGDVIYLVPVGQGQVLEQLRQMYPDALLANNTPDNAWTLEARRALFSILTVSRQMILDSQGLRLLVYQDATPDGAATPALDSVIPAPTLNWGSYPPLPPPFHAELTASLSIPEAGMYSFAADAGVAPVTMTLDDVLVLDTELGLSQFSLPLAQGIYRLALTYRSGSQPADVTILWQPPGATTPAPPPATALHAPMLDDVGLIGDYREGRDPNGMTVTRRKDRVLGFDFGLAQPFNVYWQGNLGITRAGEYLLATLADGPNEVLVDDQLVIDGRTGGADSEAADSGAAGSKADEAYNEGLIYLTPGWHTIAVRYTPQSDAPEFRLLWQPPGASPSELTSRYLLPVIGAVSLADWTPPPAPPLLDPVLGNDDFALTRAASAWRPDVRVPPSGLEPLPLETLWVAGAGCGVGENQLNAPHGLAFDPASGRLYVADTGNRRVQVLDLDGGFVSSITAPDFTELVDVAFAPEGALFVLDAMAGAIHRFGVDGTPTVLPMQTTFYRPRGFDVGADGSIAVADTGGGRVVTLTADGVVQSQFGGIDTLLARGQPVDVLFGAPALWAISAEDGRLHNLTIDGGLTAVQPTNTIDGPQMAALPTGGLIVSDPLRRTFTTFTANGQPRQQFGYLEQLVMPTGIATLTTGDSLYIAVSDVRSCTVSLWRMAVSQLQ